MIDFTPEECARRALDHLERNEPSMSSAWSELGQLLLALQGSLMNPTTPMNAIQESRSERF